MDGDVASSICRKGGGQNEMPMAQSCCRTPFGCLVGAECLDMNGPSALAFTIQDIETCVKQTLHCYSIISTSLSLIALPLRWEMQSLSGHLP